MLKWDKSFSKTNLFVSTCFQRLGKAEKKFQLDFQLTIIEENEAQKFLESY